MEASSKLTKYPQIQHQLTNQDILKSSNNVINSCDQTVTSNNYFHNNKIFKQTIKSKLPQYVFDPLQPNPQYQQIIQKYIQKLKSKLKIQQKQLTIRKSQLGQNQLVFTNQQILKLQIIDQLLEKGYQLPNDPFNIQLFPSINIEKLDIQICNKQSLYENPFKQELEEFDDWGEYGNKQYVIQMLNQYGKDCIQSINFNDLRRQKQNNKKKQLKILNFVKNMKQNYKIKKNQKDRKSTQLTQNKQNNIYSYNNNNNVKIRKVGSKIISQNQANRYTHQFVDKKQKQSIDNNNNKNSVQGSRLINTQFKKLDKNQRIIKTIQQINKKYIKIKTSTFMTPQRIQALYNCNIIKNIKKQLTNQQYIDMKIAFNYNNNNSQQKINKQKFEEIKLHCYKKQQKYDDRIHNQTNKILMINKQRLKKQKQRVIEKMRC